MGVLLAWLPIGMSALASLFSLSCAVALWLRFRGGAADPGEAAIAAHSADTAISAGAPAPGGLSMMVPIKGADDYTASNLGRLVNSRIDVPVEYLFAVETTEDPAYAICQQMKENHPDRTIRIILSGTPTTLMGKQHNLAAAFHHAQYDVLGSMDVDVQVATDTLAAGLSALGAPATGTAYFLPQYAGPGPAGGLLATLYTSYHFNLHMGAWAATGTAPFIIGALWLIRRETLQRTGGFGSFGLSVSDDAVIGRNVAKLGLMNRLVPRTVQMPFENLDLRGGLKHLSKWLGMLRAEGLGVYLLIWFSWHPLFWSTVSALAAVAWGGIPPAVAGGLIGGVALAKVLNTALLNRGVYRLPAFTSAGWLLVYDLVGSPLLFLPGLFRRTIEWKGRRYRLGRGGRILEMREVA